MEQKGKIDLTECKIFDDQISSINGDQESEFSKTFLKKMSPSNINNKQRRYVTEEDDLAIQEKQMMTLMNDMDGSLELEFNASTKRVLLKNPSFTSIDLSVIQAP